MSYLDGTAAAAVLKELYVDQTVENLAYNKNKFLTLVPKKPKATGKYIPQPIIWETSQGNSAGFTTAQANQTAAQFSEFLITRVSDYSLASITQEVMLASQDEKGSFVELLKGYGDWAIQASANRAALSLFRSGTGSRGQIASGGITSGVITLTNAADIVNFGYGQVLQANATDGGVPRAALGYVVSRNVSAGTLTVSATGQGGAPGSPASWQGTDFLLVQGDVNLTMTGLAGWLPITAPTSSDSFFNVNRSVDTRLYGLYYNGGSGNIEETVIDSAVYNAREGGSPTHFITSFGSYGALTKSLGARRQFVDFKTKGGIQFSGIELEGPSGALQCFADRSCQSATGYLLQMDTWTLYSLNPVPHIFRYGDGLEMLRISNADATEIRVGYYAQLGCAAPGRNSLVTLSV